MEILFEIFQLKEPDWTDDFHQALLSVGKIQWKIYISKLLHINVIE